MDLSKQEAPDYCSLQAASFDFSEYRRSVNTNVVLWLLRLQIFLQEMPGDLDTVNRDPSNFETKYFESLNEHTLVAENKNTWVPYEFYERHHI